MRHFTAITVEVSPSQAQELIVAQRTGKLTAMLRNPDDRQPLRPRAMDLNALLGLDPPQGAVVFPRAAGPEIIVGGRGALVPASSPGQVAIEGFRPLAPQDGVPRTDGASPGARAGDDSEALDDAAWKLHRFGRSAPRETIAARPVAEAQ
jgi:pilus assembly protein CpaB